MDKEAKKLKVMEIKQSIKANTLLISFLCGIVGIGTIVLSVIVLKSLSYTIIGIIEILVGIGTYYFLMKRGLETAKKQYKGILKFD